MNDLRQTTRQAGRDGKREIPSSPTDWSEEESKYLSISLLCKPRCGSEEICQFGIDKMVLNINLTRYDVFEVLYVPSKMFEHFSTIS